MIQPAQGLAVFEPPHIWEIPTYVVIIVQLLLLVVLVTDLALHARLHGVRLLREPTNAAGIFVALMLVVDLILYIAGRFVRRGRAGVESCFVGSGWH